MQTPSESSNHYQHQPEVADLGGMAGTELTVVVPAVLVVFPADIREDKLN